MTVTNTMTRRTHIWGQISLAYMEQIPTGLWFHHGDVIKELQVILHEFILVIWETLMKKSTIDMYRFYYHLIVVFQIKVKLYEDARLIFFLRHVSIPLRAKNWV